MSVSLVFFKIRKTNKTNNFLDCLLIDCFDQKDKIVVNRNIRLYPKFETLFIIEVDV